MLRLISIPLMVICGLPNSPNPEKPAEQTVQQCQEAETQAQNLGGSIFHRGVVAHFGLNKTSLAPQLDWKYSAPSGQRNSSDGLQKQPACSLDQQKSAKIKGAGTAELASPLTINLFL